MNPTVIKWLTSVGFGLDVYKRQYLHCGLEGLGLIQLSEVAASIYLRSGRLREVLAQARCAPVPISIVYPQARATAAVRTFVDWTLAIMREALPA